MSNVAFILLSKFKVSNVAVISCCRNIGVECRCCLALSNFKKLNVAVVSCCRNLKCRMLLSSCCRNLKCQMLLSSCCQNLKCRMLLSYLVVEILVSNFAVVSRCRNEKNECCCRLVVEIKRVDCCCCCLSLSKLKKFECCCRHVVEIKSVECCCRTVVEINKLLGTDANPMSTYTPWH